LALDTKEARRKRHRRIRKTVSGTQERPRMSVFRSLNNISVQVINDVDGRTLAAASTMDKDIKETQKYGGNTKAAGLVGKKIAEKALEKGIKKVAFDRGGYIYHGRVKALAEAAREAGLEF